MSDSLSEKNITMADDKFKDKSNTKNGKNENGTRNVKEIRIRVIELCCFALLFVAMMIAVKYTILQFDAAMNYQISENLALNFEYKSNYEDYGYNGQTGVWFDHKIQTAGTVLYLATFLNVVFGCSTANMQYAAVIHLFVLVFLVYHVLKRYAGIGVGVCAAIVILLQTFQNAYGGYGEVAAAMFILISFCVFAIALRKKKTRWYIFSGVLLGLGYLTKTVVLIAAPAFVLLFLFEWCQTKKFKTIIPYLWLVCGLLIPIAVFELCKLMVLGGDYLNWWWSEFVGILGESGMSDQLTDGLRGFLKWKANFTTYLSTYSVPGIVLLILIALPPVAFVVCYKKRSEFSKLLMLIYFVGIIYLAWWIFIVPTARLWWRRAIVGHVFLLIATIASIGILLRFLEEKKKVFIITNSCIAVCLLALGYGHAVSGVEYFKSDMQQKKNVESCVEFIHSLPENATFYGYEWWQAPLIGAEANRTILNLSENPGVYDNAYFISDFYMTYLAPDMLEDIMQQYNMELIYSQGGNNIYSISLNYPEKGAYRTLCGYYEDGWMAQQATFAVSSGSSGDVQLKGYVPWELTGNEVITVLYNGKIIAEYVLVSQMIDVHFKCPPDQSGVIEIETNFVRRATYPDVRTLSFLIEEIKVS